MRVKITSFILILIISSCKPEPEPQPCIPPIISIDSGLYGYLPDSMYQKLRYINNSNDYYSFNLLYFNHDTEFAVNRCNGGGEFLLVTYEGNNSLKEFTYLIDGGAKNLFRTFMGPNQPPLECESKFYIVTDSIGLSIDTLQLLNETFYNVYHRNAYSGSGNCCTEMYYNKQYGVVGFNWLGEWYVLETDSL